MTNLILTVRLWMNFICVTVDVPADTYVRFETRHPSATNWLARDFAEEKPYARQVTFCDLMRTNTAWYRAVALSVR